MTRCGGPVILGRLSGLYGVRGAFKVFSYTEPREAICDYDGWLIRRDDDWREFRLVDGRAHGRTVIARLDGIEDRDAATAMLGADIAVPRDRLPSPEEGEYYWADLAGLEVLALDGTSLGRVDRLFATGAHDVMVVAGERERWLPFVPDAVVREVDLEAGRITVDWDPDW